MRVKHVPSSLPGDASTGPVGVAAQLSAVLDRYDPQVTSNDMRNPAPARPDRGLLVTLSGVDGCGKSTQASLLADALQTLGENVLVMKYDAGRSQELGVGIGRLSRESADRGTEGYEADVSLLMGCDLVNFLWGAIMQAVDEGRTVIVDRYAWDFFVTVSVAFGVQDPAVARVLDRAPRPDLAVLLEIGGEDAFRRVRGRIGDQPDHPLEVPAILTRKAVAYDALAEVPGFLTLDARKPAADLHEEIFVAARRELRRLRSSGDAG